MNEKALIESMIQMVKSAGTATSILLVRRTGREDDIDVVVTNATNAAMVAALATSIYEVQEEKDDGRST